MTVILWKFNPISSIFPSRFSTRPANLISAWKTMASNTCTQWGQGFCMYIVLFFLSLILFSPLKEFRQWFFTMQHQTQPPFTHILPNTPIIFVGLTPAALPLLIIWIHSCYLWNQYLKPESDHYTTSNLATIYIHTSFPIHPSFSLGQHLQPYPYSSFGSVLATCKINTWSQSMNQTAMQYQTQPPFIHILPTSRFCWANTCSLTSTPSSLPVKSIPWSPLRINRFCQSLEAAMSKCVLQFLILSSRIANAWAPHNALCRSDDLQPCYTFVLIAEAYLLITFF